MQNILGKNYFAVRMEWVKYLETTFDNQPLIIGGRGVRGDCYIHGPSLFQSLVGNIQTSQ